jgi:hypothetical protein
MRKSDADRAQAIYDNSQIKYVLHADEPQFEGSHQRRGVYRADLGPGRWP